MVVYPKRYIIVFEGQKIKKGRLKSNFNLVVDK